MKISRDRESERDARSAFRRPRADAAGDDDTRRREKRLSY